MTSSCTSNTSNGTQCSATTNDYSQQTSKESLSSTKLPRTSELSLSIQKKLLGRMVGKKSVVKHLIDDNWSRLLDNLQQLNKLYRADVEARKKLFSSMLNNNNSPPSAKDSDKVIKYLVKIVVKIGILVMNEQFGAEDRLQAHQLQRNLRSTLMTVVSFHEVDFSYDQHYLRQCFDSCRQQLKQLIRPHLSDKSLSRVDLIFDYFTNCDFLDRFFLVPLSLDSVGTTSTSHQHTNSILIDLNSKRASTIAPSFLCPQISSSFQQIKCDIIRDINTLLEHKHF